MGEVDPVALVRWAQVAALWVGAVAAVGFLAAYLPTAELRWRVARFVVALNVTYVVVVVLVTWGRVFPQTFVVEVAKAVALLAASGVMGYQVVLLGMSRRDRGSDGAGRGSRRYRRSRP